VRVSVLPQRKRQRDESRYMCSTTWGLIAHESRTQDCSHTRFAHGTHTRLTHTTHTRDIRAPKRQTNKRQNRQRCEERSVTIPPRTREGVRLVWARNEHHQPGSYETSRTCQSQIKSAQDKATLHGPWARRLSACGLYGTTCHTPSSSLRSLWRRPWTSASGTPAGTRLQVCDARPSDVSSGG